MIRDELEGIWHILLKDLKAYYFKPPNISWGILFPLGSARLVRIGAVCPPGTSIIG